MTDDTTREAIKLNHERATIRDPFFSVYFNDSHSQREISCDIQETRFNRET